MERTRVGTRLDAEELRRVDAAATERGTSRAEVLRTLTRRELLDAPDRMTLEEALDLLDAKARAGNVQAIIRIVERLERVAADAPDPRADLGLRAVS